METMRTLEFFDYWAAAYAVMRGVPLLRVIPASWASCEFDDTDGAACRALGEWVGGQAVVPAREYAGAVRQVRRLARGPQQQQQQQTDVDA